MKSNASEILNKDRLPQHVAIIMDGNGRWAKKRRMNRIKGHEKGSQTVRSIVTSCREIGIKMLTLYAFSTENWRRPQAEVKALMMLLKKFIVSERQLLKEYAIRLNIIGQAHKLPADVRNEVDTTLRMIRHNDQMILNLAISYGSREEITTAVKAIASRILNKEISVEDITPDLISAHLYTAALPDPDLIIRTSGEYRLSNFLMWQAAYAELYITQTLWPDFSREEFIDILKNYQERDRRFGKVSYSTSNGG